MTGPLFLLGAPKPNWLWGKEIAFPVFVSYRQLSKVVRLKPATCPWALDSSGFTILANQGRFTISPAQYVSDVHRYQQQVGNLMWAAPQDWMCEPAVIHGGRFAGMTFVGTKLNEVDHQRRTVANYLKLTELWRHEIGTTPCPIRPAVQGWATPESYLRCVEMYRAAGVDLTAVPLVGVGSVCRLQHTAAIGRVVSALAQHGLRLHGFGVKTLGLERYGHHLISADSQAWSRKARYRPPLPGCTHKNCANCLIYATQWRDWLLNRLATQARRGRQTDLFDHLPASSPSGESAA